MKNQGENQMQKTEPKSWEVNQSNIQKLLQFQHQEQQGQKPHPAWSLSKLKEHCNVKLKAILKVLLAGVRNTKQR